MKSDSTLAHGSTFFVTDTEGQLTRAYDGLYDRDTRHLSTYALSAGERDLTVLDVAAVRPGERVIYLGSEMHVGARALHVARRQVVSDGFCERIEVTNLTNEPLDETLALNVAADFDDLFEVRGDRRYERAIAGEEHSNGVTFTYDPDTVAFTRRTSVTVDPAPTIDVTTGDSRAEATLTLPLSLEAHETVSISIACLPEESRADPTETFAAARSTVRDRETRWYEQVSVPTVDDHDWQSVLDRSVEDLLALTIDTEFGPMFTAGTPWFATQFGRDSLIAAYQALPLTTETAKGTLRSLAAHQATEIDEFRDAEPGKILHEIRHGELAVREDVPHSPYYGTIDATALWIIVLHATWRHMDDDTLVEELWDTLDAALAWCEEYGDRNDNYFLEYPVDGENGSLTHQAWKDSGDGIIHTDGTHPEGPLAVAEVQGYYYDALCRAAELHQEVSGDPARAASLDQRAANLKAAFNEKFWLPTKEFYAVALDGNGESVDSVTSNPGHCLWSGIVPDDHARAVIDQLVASDMFTGWGVRTLSSDSDAYNPQSYHLGSVWPHDNSLIALGMERYGFHDEAVAITQGLFNAAVERGDDRLPELFAGFNRSDTDVPVQYGVACEPQAWAAGAPIACLAALHDEYSLLKQPLSVEH
jgi:glycogen debranching enzyme